MKSKLLIYILLLAISTVFIVKKSALAVGGVTVSPAQIELVISEDNRIASTAVSIRNDYEIPITIDLALHEVDTNSGNLTPKSETTALSKHLTVNPNKIEIEPGKTKNIKLELINNQELSPGGHYAALVIKHVQDKHVSVSLQSAVSVMIFITKQNGSIQKLSISEFGANGWLFKLPNVIKIEIKNEGNVHLVPRASISVFAPNGKLIATGAINEASLNIFPNKSLLFNGKLNWQSRTWLPGRYNISVTYRYDNSDNPSTINKTYWYIPPYILVIFVVLIAIIYFNRKKLINRTRSEILTTIPAKTTKKPNTIRDIVPSSKSRKNT